MPLKVVTGRANAGKTGQILRWALEALREGLSPTLIVPSLADVRRMQMELSGKAPLGVRVSTARSFAQELWQLHGDGRRLVGDATRSAVIKKILAGPIQESLAASAKTPGFERLMVRLAEQSSPGEETTATVTSEADSLVIELLKEYRSELDGIGLIETEWVGRILAEAPPRFGFLGAVRFNSYSEPEIDFLRALSERNTVCVALTWEEEFAATAANDGAAAVLLGHGQEVRVAKERPGASEVGMLADCLFGKADPVLRSGEVVFGEAKGREGEAALVAGLAAAAVRSGVPAERVAVVFPRLASRLNLLRDAFAAEGIEADFDCPLVVGATSFGRALAALLRIALGRGARDEALEFLQGPFSDADSGVVLHLDSEWRRGRHTADGLRVLNCMIELGGSSGYAVSLCRDVARAPVSEDTADGWQKLADTLVSTAAVLDAQGLRREDLSAHRSVTRAIAQMASVPGHPFGAADVLEVLPTLRCALSSEESAGRIQVIQASHVGSRRFDEMIIGGLTQSEFPGVSRETFATEVGALVSHRTTGIGESVAALEFYSLLTRARKRLALVRQTVSSEGAMEVASPWLDEVCEAYRDRAAVQEDSGAVSGPPTVERCEDVRAFAPVFTRGRREERLLPEDLVPAARSVSRGVLDPELAKRAVGGRVFSATEIEAYLECPYRWFYSHVVRPGDIDVELDAAALGSRAHRLIADFYEALVGEGRDRVTTETLPAALRLFERTSEQSEKRMMRPVSMGEEIDVARARLWARHVVEDDAGFLPGYAPHGHEVGFGGEPIFEFAGVPFAGRIDRIDASPAGLVVSDYKSTRDVGKLARPGSGFGIQHVLYAVAAEQLLGRQVQGSVYRSLRSRQLRGFWRRDLLGSLPPEACEKDVVDETGFSALVALVEERVAAAVDGIRAGRIPRARIAAAACTYCPLVKICEGARPR